MNGNKKYNDCPRITVLDGPASLKSICDYVDQSNAHMEDWLLALMSGRHVDCELSEKYTNYKLFTEPLQGYKNRHDIPFWHEYSQGQQWSFKFLLFDYSHCRVGRALYQKGVVEISTFSAEIMIHEIMHTIDRKINGLVGSYGNVYTEEYVELRIELATLIVAQTMGISEAIMTGKISLARLALANNYQTFFARPVDLDAEMISCTCALHDAFTLASYFCFLFRNTGELQQATLNCMSAEYVSFLLSL